MRVRHPKRTIAIADHYTPTSGTNKSNFTNIAHYNLYKNLESNASKNNLLFMGLNDSRRGIVHVVGPEQGLSLPGMTIVCGDSHTATHGAMGALAFGIGASDVSHVLATQTLWQPRPKSMRVNITGRRAPHVSAKDIILTVIRNLGASGGTGHVIEYAGPVISNLSVEERLTVCNMSIEAGARAGMMAPDDKLINWIAGKGFAPCGKNWDKALTNWRVLKSDPDAIFDKEKTIDSKDIIPMVTWGTSPEDALPINEKIPDPNSEPEQKKRNIMSEKLEYMGLKPGQALTDIKIDRVFIGSCTNSRIDDLRAAAAVAKGRRAAVPAMVVPGSAAVSKQAKQEGIDRIFINAGFDWRPAAGCSMCVGVNGDVVPPGQRCVSTSNRNFRGRQGPRARTHLVGSAMAAAAAVTGKISDVRAFEAR